MQKRLHLLMALLAFMVTTAMAQITTSSVSGKITANGEDVIGATIKAVHQPSGTVYRAVTNMDGRYSIQGMRPGGPYVLEVTYVGYKNKQVKGISLSLGQNTVLNETLAEDAAQLEDVVVVADRNNNMRTDRAGATTSINADQIEAVPTVSRSMNDLLKLTPQGANVGSGFSVGGGNYRQSYVTVDGAAFNNAFGIGGNLPGNGSPISLDALDQISVSSSPYDVRLSGFTGGAISAVTKSGTNDFKGTIRILEKANGQGEAVLMNSDNTRIFNPNTALRTTYLMSVLFAIGKLATQRSETEFPLIFDAPTSSFTDAKETEFFNVISNLDKQVVIVTKSFLKESSDGNLVLDQNKVNEVSGRVFRIEKKKPFDDKDLATIQTVITKVK